MNQTTSTTQRYLDLMSQRFPTSANYYKKTTLMAIETEDGELLPFDKEHIKTDFCFGESGYDYEDAQRSAHVARNSQQYFIDENLAPISERIKDIENSRDNEVYIGHSGIKGRATYTVTNAMTKFNYPWMLKDMRPATEAEKKAILEALNAVRQDLEKRVKTYLKRYGTSKVHAWTYWRDA